MKKSIFISIVIIVLGGAFFLVNNSRQQSPRVNTTPPTLTLQKNSADYKASFAIFTSGTFRIFTASMYHNLSKNVFIEASNPNIVHIKKRGVTWDDFFKTLPFKLTRDCLTTGTGETFCTKGENRLKFYLSGVKTNDLLNKEIMKDDKTLITYGSENEDDIQKQIKRLNKISSP